MNKKLLFYIMLLISWIGYANAQVINIPKYSSYGGRHFYLAFPQNELFVEKLTLKLYVSAVLPTKYKITYPGGSVKLDSLKMFGIQEYDLMESLEIKTAEIPTNLVLEIESDNPICCYAFSSRAQTSDSYSAIPISRWGNEYYIISYPNDQYDPSRSNLDPNNIKTPRPGEFNVIGAYDSTDVTVNLPVNSNGKISPNTPFTFRINKGQSYLIQSASLPKGEGDLTGSHIKSTKPVGVLTGHTRSSVPQDLPYPYDTKDFLIEMLSPVTSCGKHFFSAPYGVNYKGDLFRVVAVEAGGTLEIKTGGKVYNYNFAGAGDWKEIRDISEAAEWTASKRVQICQFMAHSGDASDNSDYDPAMALLSPTEQYVESVVFLTPYVPTEGDPQFDKHSVCLIAEKAALADMYFNGVSIQDYKNIEIKDIPGTEYCWFKTYLTLGRQDIISGSGKFSGLLYGTGIKDSYAMSMGHSLYDPFVIDTVAPLVNVTENCGKLIGNIKDIGNTAIAGIDYVYIPEDKVKNYEWNISKISDTATVASFEAWPANIYEDAYFELTAFDKNSKARKYTFTYQGFKLGTPKELYFTNINWLATVCNDFTITNFSGRPVTIQSGALNGDPRLSFTMNPPLPYELPPNATMTGQVCFTPKGDSAKINSTLQLFTNCNLTYNIPVKGSVLAPNISADTLDFGDVLIKTIVAKNDYIKNTGNVEVRMDSIPAIKPASEFSANWGSRKNSTLKPAEIDTISVTFAPMVRQQYEEVRKIYNNKDLDRFVVIKGKGVAPVIGDLKLDFGRTRVGYTKTLDSGLKNSGDYTAQVQYVKTSVGDDSDPNISALTAVNSNALKGGQSINFSLQYTPADTSNYRIETKYLTDWKYHDSITIQAFGKGTIPTEKAFNYIFDTTTIFESRTIIYSAIASGGNEKLTIDSIYALSGDLKSFNLAYKAYKNNYIQPGDSLRLGVEFAPKKVGEHKIVLLVSHDANPNYARSIDTITISGICVPADTVLSEIACEIPVINTCEEKEGYFVVRNKGNVDMNLQKLILTKNPDNFTFDFKNSWLSTLPVMIKSGDTIRIPIAVYAERKTGGRVKLDMTFNDSIKHSLSYDVVPNTGILDIISTSVAEAQIGDTVLIKLAGKFPHKIDALTDFKFKLATSYDDLDLVTKTGVLKIKDSGIEKTYPIQFSQTSNAIIIDFGLDSLDVLENRNWEFEFAVTPLYSKVTDAVIEYSAIADKCFDPGLKKFIIKIANVCTSDLRHTKIILNLSYAILKTNIVSENIDANIYSIDEDDVKTKIFDINGRICKEFSKINLKKGNQNIIFDISDLASGKYIVCFEGKRFSNREIIIISK